jgi:hypothetical protein
VNVRRRDVLRRPAVSYTRSAVDLLVNHPEQIAAYITYNTVIDVEVSWFSCALLGLF